jgi:ABC-type transporter Mla MlaB component
MAPGNIEVSEFRGHISPEAQEAAVRYANGSPAEAGEILSRAIAEPRTLQDSQLLWLMLFELYRLQSRWPDFDELSKRYTATYGKPAPDWIIHEALPDSLPGDLRRGGAGYCEISGELGSSSTAQIEAIGRVAAGRSVVHVDLTKVQSLTEEGCERLDRALRSLVTSGNGVFLSGSEHFDRLLRAAVDTSPKAEPYWRLMLQLYQLEGRQKQFESAALEYALFVETDPPGWEPALLPVMPQTVPRERRDEPRYGTGPEVISFHGEMSGPNDPQLVVLRQFAQGRKYVNINFAGLTRIDPVCAANLGNTVLALANQAKVVRILKPNLLIGTLLRMLKIDEHAGIVDPKPAP